MTYGIQIRILGVQIVLDSGVVGEAEGERYMKTHIHK